MVAKTSATTTKSSAKKSPALSSVSSTVILPTTWRRNTLASLNQYQDSSGSLVSNESDEDGDDLEEDHCGDCSQED